MRSLILLLTLALIAVFSGANGNSVSVTNITLDETQVSYTKEVQPVFSKNCASCHNAKSGLGNWLNYDEAFAKRYEIQRRVVNRTMPVHGGTNMTESEREIVDMWVKTGGAK